MISSSCSIWAYARRPRSASGGPYLRAAPRAVSSRSQVISVWPSGTGKSGSLRRHQREVERAGAADLGGQRHRPGVAGEPGRHLLPGAQVGGAGRREPAVHLVEAAPGPDRGERRGEPPAAGRRGVGVRGRHHAEPGPARQRGQRVVAVGVEREAVVGELDQHVVPAEEIDQPVELAAGGSMPGRTVARRRLATDRVER